MYKGIVTVTTTASILLAGLLIAEAMTWRGAANIRTVAETLNPAEVVHCRRWGRCPRGMRLACDDLGRCRCVPC